MSSRAPSVAGGRPAQHAAVVDAEQQTEYAHRLAHMLNAGVLQDAVAAGLEEQGQFEIDTLDLLDALESAGLQLVPRDPTA